VPGTEGAVLFAFGTSEPSVVCAVLQICDVQLQPGENINSVNVGDSARWLIEPAVSNSGPNETQHLIIKPLDANLNTTLIVTTDRRTYHIRLVSHRTQFMSRVAFTYPDEAQAKWAAFRARSDTARAENTMAVPDGARGTGREGANISPISISTIALTAAHAGSPSGFTMMASKPSSKCRTRWSRRKRHRC
jgi:type IV secretion system protein VirB9